MVQRSEDPTTTPYRIARAIADQVISGQLAPGASLREIPLAAEFGVGRSSIREALRILERDGVVEILARRGARVTLLNTDQMIEIYQIRSVLLGLAMSLFAERCDEEAISALELLYERMRTIRASDNIEHAARHAELSAALARYVVERSGNIHLLQMLSAMSMQIARYTVVGMSSPERRQQSLSNWRHALDCLKRRDSAAAELAGRRLVRDTLARALGQLMRC